MSGAAAAAAPGRMFRPAVRLLLVPAAFVLFAAFLVPLVSFLSRSVRSDAGAWTLDHASGVLGDPYYWGLVWNSFCLGVTVTGLTLLLAYPTALIMTAVRGTRLFLVIAIAVFSPLLTSVIVRSYGWLYVLSDSGVVNWALVGLGVVDQPVRLIFNWIGTVVAMVHIEMPFMMFPILSVLLQLPPSLQNAAQDLGANAFQTWRRVVLPLSLPGVLAGSQVVFATSISSFATPTILGGGRVRVLPVSIYSSIEGIEWSVGAVQAVLLLALSLVFVNVFTRLLRTRVRGAGKAA